MPFGNALWAINAAQPNNGIVITDLVANVFKGLDVNSDGLISAAEVSSVRIGFHADATAFATAFAAVDANNDGSISKAELTAYVGKADTNGDGVITLTEAQAQATSVGLVGGFPTLGDFGGFAFTSAASNGWLHHG